MPRLKPKSATIATNKTREYINSFGPTHPGNQAFWGEALTDIPHPTEKGKVMKYSEFKDYLHSPSMLAHPEYNDEAKRNAYGNQVFKDAQTRFYQKADANPGEYAFPTSASDALNKPIEEFAQKHGEYATPANGKVVDSNSEAQRFEDIRQSRGITSTTPKYEKGTSSIKVKDKAKRKLLQKAASGLTDVVVPEAGNTGNVLSSGLSLATTGAEIAGPWGGVVGGAVGLASGVLQKKKQDEANQRALAINNTNRMNRAYDGVESTINQKTQVYEKGTKSIKRKKSKLIEAEHNEHVFDKNLNHKGVIKGNTHKEGGEIVKVEEGDSIFPAKHKTTVDTHLQNRDKKSLKKLRGKLPKDTANGKAKFGLDTSGDEIPDPLAYAKRDKSLRVATYPETGQPLFANNKNRVGQYGAYDQAITGLSDGSSTYLNRGDKGNPYPYSVVRNSQGNMYKHTLDNSPLALKSLTAAPTSVPSTVIGTSTPFESIPSNTSSSSPTTSVVDTPNGGVGNALKYANVANNLIKGMQTPKPIEQNYLDPELLKYQDRSETLRRESRGNQAIQSSNARNLAGGNIGNMRVNQAAAGTTNLENQDSINEREMARADGIDNTNVGIKNNAKQVNLGRKDMYTDQLLKQRAVQDDYLSAATQEATQLAERNEQTRYLKSRDAKEDQKDQDALSYLNGTTRYKINQTTKDSEFNPQSGGNSSTIPTSKTSTTKTVDKNGKESTRTTTSAGGTKSSTVSDIFGKRLKGNRKLR